MSGMPIVFCEKDSEIVVITATKNKKNFINKLLVSAVNFFMAYQ
jgi:hypothetical protein